jgi:hypothetical protein
MSDAYRMRSRNCLLVKDDVGRAKPSCYELPHEAHAFGRAEPADMEGAREVTMHWASHVPRPKNGPDCQDFRKINKMAAKQHVTTSKQLTQFRQANDVKLLPQGPAGAMPKVIPSDVIPSFAYGRKCRPSTPITYVVGNQYAAEFEEALDSKYNHYETQQERATSKLSVQLTRAASQRIVSSRTARHAPPPSEKVVWKMKKFAKAQSRLIPKSASLPTLVTEKAAGEA